MSRDIKFRAWTKNGGMVDLKAITPLALADGLLEAGDADGLFIPFRKDITLMQFTGLQDKNGKDIYEGDIVNCSSGCPHVIEWNTEIGGKYIGGMPGWYLSGLVTGGGEGYAWTKTEEIIGNIYENPELLN